MKTLLQTRVPVATRSVSWKQVPTRDPLRVMHVIDSLAVGGAERALVEIANHSLSCGIEVSVCLTRTRQTLAPELHPEISLSRLCRRRRFDWLAVRRFAGLVRARRVDVLHAHGRSTMAFVAFAKTAAGLRLPVIMHDHFGAIETHTSVPLWLRLGGSRFLWRYIAPCATTSAFARRAGIPPRKVRVVEYALDLQRVKDARAQPIRESLGLSPHVALGICVAGVRPEKGIHTLLEALSLLPRQTPVKVLIAGASKNDAYWRHCRRKTEELGLDERILFLGQRTDVPSLLKSVDFGIHPAISESGPLVLAEFMAAALPFVGTRVGGVSARAEKAGLPEFVAPGDPRALADALARLLALSVEARHSRVNSGLRVAQQYFDIRRRIHQWHQLYEAAAKRSLCSC